MQGLRGEFLVRGEWIPNQFTLDGAELLLQSAFWRSGSSWRVGLCSSLPSDYLTLLDVAEPTPGNNGYDRQILPMNAGAWPTIGQSVGEVFVESREIEFDISAPLDVQVNRLFLTDGTIVIAISTAIFDSLTTLDAPLTTKYRFYFR